MPDEPEAAYLERLCQRDGLLFTVHGEGFTVTLHGDGHGSALIRGAEDIPEVPLPIRVALQRLADLSVLEDASEFTSTVWKHDDVATLLAPYLDDYEFVVDGCRWYSDGRDADPSAPGDMGNLILAADTWDMEDEDEDEEGGWLSPGSGTQGGMYLLRIGPRYAIYQENGEERTHERDLDAPDDATAIAIFKGDVLGTP